MNDTKTKNRPWSKLTADQYSRVDFVVCPECGAAIVDYHQGKHAEWHRELDSALRPPG